MLTSVKLLLVPAGATLPDQLNDLVTDSKEEWMPELLVRISDEQIQKQRAYTILPLSTEAMAQFAELVDSLPAEFTPQLLLEIPDVPVPPDWMFAGTGIPPLSYDKLIETIQLMNHEEKVEDLEDE